MLSAKRKKIENNSNLRLQSQIGEEERFRDLMRRMARPLGLEELELESIVLPGAADVRVEADGLSPIFVTLEEGTEVKVIRQDGDWYEVIVGEEIGYIYKDALNLPEEEVEEPVEVEVEEILPEVEKKVTIFTSRRTVMTLGEPVYLTSKLEGFDGYEIKLQWMRDSGEGFEPIEGANSETYEFEASAESLSWDWQLMVYYR